MHLAVLSCLKLSLVSADERSLSKDKEKAGGKPPSKRVT